MAYEHKTYGQGIRISESDHFADAIRYSATTSGWDQNKALSQWATATASSTSVTLDKKMIEEILNQFKSSQTQNQTATEIMRKQADVQAKLEAMEKMRNAYTTAPVREKSFDEICDEVANELKRG